MTDEQPLVVVGSGWLGTAVAGESPDAIHVAQREFDVTQVPHGATMIVASGWSSLPAEGSEERVRSELDDVARVLDAARQRDARVVVVGSSDVCGLAEIVTGRTPVDPVTAYGELKARREALVVAAAAGGVDAVAVRLAPTHGPGKAQTARMLALARRPVVPLPRGGRYSVGFVTLADAVGALHRLGRRAAEFPVASVGGGRTVLRTLMCELTPRTCRVVPIPVPVGVARRLALTDRYMLAWIGRFSLPRSVEMEAPMTPMTVAEAADYLLGSDVA